MASSVRLNDGALSKVVTATFFWLLDIAISSRPARQSWLSWWNDGAGEKDSFQAAMAWIGLFLPLSFTVVAAFAALYGPLSANGVNIATLSWLPAGLIGLSIGGFLVNYIRHVVNPESTPTLFADLLILASALGLGLAAFFQTLS